MKLNVENRVTMNTKIGIAESLLNDALRIYKGINRTDPKALGALHALEDALASIESFRLNGGCNG